MRRMTGAAVALGALLLGGAGLGACGSGPGHAETTASIKQQAKCQSGLPTVTVQGNGSVEGTPNQAILSLGVQTQAATAAAAMNANATKSNALVKVMETDGVPVADLQTSGLSIQPNYNNAGTVITSYQVTNSVTVTLNNLALSGTIIDDAARVAGNAVRVDGITFALKNETALLGEARAAAVEQAVGQARVMASAAGTTLGPLCSLQDNSSLPGPQPVFPEFAAASARSAAPTPIEAGSEQVTANVTVVYQLNTATAATASTSAQNGA
jgi:uncharacterized protein